MVSNRILGKYLHDRRPEIIPSDKMGEIILVDLLLQLNGYEDKEIIQLVRRQ